MFERERSKKRQKVLKTAIEHLLFFEKVLQREEKLPENTQKRKHVKNIHNTKKNLFEIRFGLPS